VRLAQVTSPDAANGASATPPVEEATPTGTVIPIQAEPGAGCGGTG
jgi:hypothetical protein